jgi:Na+-driven multidrug efflux pump
VRVSNELGAGHPKAASFSVKVVTIVSFTVASTIAAVLMCLRDYLSYVFTKGDDVARAVSAMTPLLAVTIVFNGIQPVLSGTHSYSSNLSRSSNVLATSSIVFLFYFSLYISHFYIVAFSKFRSLFTAGPIPAHTRLVGKRAI